MKCETCGEAATHKFHYEPQDCDLHFCDQHAVQFLEEEIERTTVYLDGLQHALYELTEQGARR